MGRLAFPLFSFCLAQGWKKTRSRKRYFENLVCGALSSQIPFSMALNAANLETMQSNTLLVDFDWSYLFCAMLAAGLYWLLVMNKHYERSVSLVALAALIPGIRMQIQGFWFLNRNTNVFYTFLMAFFCLYILADRDAWGKQKRMAAFFAIPFLLVAYGLPADYGVGLLGILLIVGFSLLDRKGEQVAFLVLWSILYYGLLVGNFASMFCCALSGVFILLYDPQAKGGPRAKKFFYGYYPTHLLLLGLFNLKMKW